MKLSLPLRIFLVHLLFMVALGALGVQIVRWQFAHYKQTWEQKLSTVPSERLFSPVASEIARSLLLRLERSAPEALEERRRSVGRGLEDVLATVSSIERLVIVDSEKRVQYADPPSALGLTFAGDTYDSALESADPVEREVQLPSGEHISEVVLPVFDNADGDEPRRLGAVLIQYRPRSGVEPGPEQLDPVARAVARSLLLATEGEGAEDLEAYKLSVSDGLNKVLPTLPIEALVIVDAERRIQYVNDPQYLDLTFAGSDAASLFEPDQPTRQQIPGATPEAEEIVEMMLPVFDQVEPGQPLDDRRRLGSVLIRYRSDPGLLERIPALYPPSVDPGAYVQSLILFLAVAVVSGILLAALTGLPVRRMERAMADFKARGFKGGLQLDGAGLPRELASAAQAITELGGRLESLDAQGREREALLATLSKSLEDGMVALDPSWRPVAWNPAALRILGAEPQPTEQPDPELEEVDEAARLEDALLRNPDLRAVALSDAPRELEVLRADGSGAIARVTQVPFEVRPGEPGCLLFIRDLAALRKVETHLLEAGRFAVLTHLAASLAHEVRNPLHAIQLNASVIEQYVDASGREKGAQAVAESVETIKDEARRLTDLLNNYLGMVRTGEESTPVDLRDLCGRVVQLVDYAAQQSKVEIRLEGDPRPPLVHGAPNRLQQAILNLVLNAIQAMPEGGTLTLHTDSLDGVVRLTVSDTGPGLPQELADQLFDTRVTTKPEGSGLGLPLVRLIVEAHGGGVWYRSTPGKGAAFTLVLPSRPDA